MRLRADFAFRELPLRKLQSGYLEGNEASRRAQAAAGYREVGRFHGQFFREGRWLDEILTELLREDWEKKQADSTS
jgi:RimJ/RimL family protein N-acetyltransferase